MRSEKYLEEVPVKAYGKGELAEMYYPDSSTFEEALAVAKKYHLHVTGGSDFHGEKVKPDIRMASLELELGTVAE